MCNAVFKLSNYRTIIEKNVEHSTKSLIIY